MITLRIDKLQITLTDKNEKSVKSKLQDFAPDTKVEVFVDGVYFDTCEIQDIFNEAR